MTIEDAPVSDVSEQRPLLDQPVSESIANTNASESTTGETVPASVGASKKRVNGGDEVSGADRDSTKKLKAGGSDDEAKESRRPKRKVACLIGYCGTGYHGLQVNPGLKTIEGTLFEAFVKAGAVSQANADDPKKVSFGRTARTDKGVHAAVNVISLKMVIEDGDILEKINQELPDQIRVWRILRTIKSFNPRTSCDSRIYEYLLPTSAFVPPGSKSEFAQKIQTCNADTVLKDSAASFWSEVDEAIATLKSSELYLSIRDDDPDIGNIAHDRSIRDEDKPLAAATRKREKLVRATILRKKRDFRISSERLASLKAALQVFVGTKNFHNYTVGQHFNQPNSMRVIRSFEAGTPFLIDGTEWVSLKVHGQSFMLHQIRKMVAMVLLVVRSGCALTRMQRSFQKQRMNIPKSPALGLLLERPVFEVYNRKADACDRENVELGDALDDTVTRFKMTHVYDKIYAEEEAQSVFYTFLASLDAYGAAGEFEYLFTDAEILPRPAPQHKHKNRGVQELGNDGNGDGRGVQADGDHGGAGSVLSPHGLAGATYEDPLADDEDDAMVKQTEETDG